MITDLQQDDRLKFDNDRRELDQDPRLAAYADAVADAAGELHVASVRLTYLQDVDDADRLQAYRDAHADALGQLLVRKAEAAEVADDGTAPESKRTAADEAVACAERAKDRTAAQLDAAQTVRGPELIAAEEAVARARRRWNRAETDLELARITLASDLAGDADTQDDRAPNLYYGSVDEWFRKFFRYVYRRKIENRQRIWIAEWWKSSEAISRLESLWRSWESLRLEEATGISVWWRDHVDHHMPILMNPDGPLRKVHNAKPAESNHGDPLPYTEPPPGMFPDVRKQDQQR